MKTEHISWTQLESLTHEIIRQISVSRWQPEYVVGITRGGLITATMLSHYFNCDMHTLKVSLRNNQACESNCWMAEDAFAGKNILLVDDINDTGSTLNWIVEDWKALAYPHNSKWDLVWNNSVRFATLFNKTTSDFIYDVDYSAIELTPDHEQRINCPWESWWCNKR